ncbi:hypothetical protein Vadar_007671 [Vaccinium darrowii]|uniref:Uncharacterized protein n=1 Tax=Vaccinium darrowii TaxID=229202 RepID=A0ACB7Z2F5_9ERIC|nr:hypothetical protein Vadar_007671 [Vaccinium darrowii]
MVNICYDLLPDIIICPESLLALNLNVRNVESIIGWPWVITENLLRCGTFRTAVGSLMPISQRKFKNRSTDDELKVDLRGGKEYNVAKCMRDLFMEFIEYQQRLHKRLALEEKLILQRLHKRSFKHAHL